MNLGLNKGFDNFLMAIGSSDKTHQIGVTLDGMVIPPLLDGDLISELEIL